MRICLAEFASLFGPNPFGSAHLPSLSMWDSDNVMFGPFSKSLQCFLASPGDVRVEIRGIRTNSWRSATFWEQVWAQLTYVSRSLSGELPDLGEKLAKC